MVEGVYSYQNEYVQKAKNSANEMRNPILVRYVISGETWFHYFGGRDVSYISDLQYELIAAGDTTEG